LSRASRDRPAAQTGFTQFCAIDDREMLEMLKPGGAWHHASGSFV